jgi:hypothetical protein
MDYAYEAEEIRVLGRCIREGLVYRGKKPVLWCPSCGTALAEAEVEYQDDRSPSVYVAYPFVAPLPPPLAGLDAPAAAIWTTTPWTLPASLAVAVHPEHEYVAADFGGRTLVVAAALVPALVRLLGQARESARFRGAALEGARCRHPWLERTVPIVLADYVTLETGTGLVHTAPGHGQEDYETGLRYGLDVLAPVDARGRFTAEVPEWAGKNVFEANAPIIDHLGAAGTLLAAENVVHSYPHCWRCKNPVVFRATEQWFIGMERADLRRRALAEIDRVRWIPAWGKERIANMIATRPDWCISRQRDWGVPVVAMYCDACGEPIASEALCAHVADVFEREGADAWYRRPAAELVPPGTSCPKCGGTTFRSETDILDVWFDSGVSWKAVVERRPELGGHADLYLEGSDQHRGWFHSALLTGVAVEGRAPYDIVITHGFFVDGSGRKMSKSLGNVIAPEEIINRHGAELLRLWVAATDYREEMRISEEIPERLRRGVPARPQHGALPPREPLRLRPRARCRSGRAASRARAVGAPPDAPARRALSPRVRGLRVPRRLPRAQQLLQRRHERALHGRAEGSALLRARRRSRAARDADGAPRDPRHARAARRADPLLHRRGRVAVRAGSGPRRQRLPRGHPGAAPGVARRRPRGALRASPRRARGRDESPRRGAPGRAREAVVRGAHRARRRRWARWARRAARRSARRARGRVPRRRRGPRWRRRDAGERGPARSARAGRASGGREVPALPERPAARRGRPPPRRLLALRGVLG